ncbi:MAG: UDP-N-acetylglucosamine--N-acetylmuramyl-(pentapeptide) pyrophosphoryl-undecaprenol N-acetylglucosamine transferase [Burkholderiaceae bacterium]|nr:UDP-N-acetylglucosamine--N-acetylmuramyl-(pentapeptide) pyrophosphoryl-undecaprenol N-acetylglucosamine transferase [Microbacteriaceae bacterium]
MTRYLLAGGGTAGHVNPLLATADRLMLRAPDSVVLVLGTAEGLESRLVPERGYELSVIEKLPFPRRPNLAALKFPGRFATMVRGIEAVIRDRGIDVVVGFGGYVSAPAYLAARRAGVPIVVHEANARPGMANRLGSWLTRSVAVTFPRTPLRGARVTGMPLRAEIESIDRAGSRRAGYPAFGLDPTRLTLLVTGGSLGARSINETLAAAVPFVLGAGWQVLHISGTRADIAFPTLAGYVVLPYCNRMDLAIAVADLVVARAGSSTVSELTALGVPAVYVPLAIGNGEQRVNARDAVDGGAAVLVENADFTAEWVADQLLPLLQDRAAIAAMAASATAIGVRDGADRLVDLIEAAVAGSVLR